MSLRPRPVGSGNLLGIATSLTLLAMTTKKSLSIGLNLMFERVKPLKILTEKNR